MLNTRGCRINPIFRIYKRLAGKFAVSRFFIRPRKVEADVTLWPTRRVGELGSEVVKEVTYEDVQERAPGQSG